MTHDGIRPRNGKLVAMLVGNNVNGAYSESDMIRERAADNLCMAGDSQLMQLNSGSRLTVSVPANTKIYVVWTQRERVRQALRLTFVFPLVRAALCSVIARFISLMAVS
jgi:hypothetical protein